jgi:starvation-inducible DNA-binding protein
MEELVEKLKSVLADSFAFYMKAHGYHWNVIGSDFPQLHDFFADLYGEVHGAVDDIAEHIRQLDAFAPGTLARMKELSTLSEDESIPKAEKMVTNLLDANENLLTSLTECYTMAEEMKEFGLSNFLQDRITAHEKHSWKLKATAGKKS